MFSDSRHRINPEVRQWFLFPNYLMHSVYPFKSDKDDERISFSFNATVVFDNEYKPTN